MPTYRTDRAGVNAMRARRRANGGWPPRGLRV